MLNSKFIKSIAIVSTIGLMVSGCGNSSSSDSVLLGLGYNGKLVDSAIDGATWKCGTKSGVTKGGGLFGSCPFGTKATFSIGNIVLGSVGATTDLIFTLNDVVGVSRDDTNNEAVKNMASLIQSLDNDGDPSNGIGITPAVIEKVNEKYPTSTPVSTLNPTKIEEITVATGTTFIDEDTALQNANSTLDDVKSGVVTKPTQPTDQSTN